jgi:hypothetical protein
MKRLSRSFVYVAASWGYAHSDTAGTAVILVKGDIDQASAAVRNTVEKKAEYEEMMGSDCDGRTHCWTTNPSVFSCRMLFSAAELKAHRQDLLAGEVVWL